MQGMAFPKGSKIEEVLRGLRASLHQMRVICAKEVPSAGLRPDLLNASSTQHKVHMVYASAIPVKAYLNAGNLDVPFQEEVGRLVIISQYLGALRLAAMGPDPTSRQRIFLMPLGGGVFNNRPEVIVGALGTALDLLAQQMKVDLATRLDVRLLAFRGSAGEQERLTKILSLLSPAPTPAAAPAAPASTPTAPAATTASALPALPAPAVPAGPVALAASSTPLARAFAAGAAAATVATPAARGEPAEAASEESSRPGWKLEARSVSLLDALLDDD
eukprot:s1781_g12.t4